MKRNELMILDVGDSSVGMSSFMIMNCELNEEFLAQMQEDKTLNEFRRKLEALCAEYMIPETYYASYMEQDEDWRKENENNNN